jgi:SMI1 / KNR4 family (SUKH-1)
MEIEYLIKMKNTPKIKNVENRGISEIKINELEQKLNIKLPKAYKEFLFLGGDYEELLSGWEREFDDLDWIQDLAKKSMQRVDLSLKPLFAFAEYGNDQFLFFFLSEGDNPAVYTYDEMKIHKDEQGNYAYYKKTDETFSKCIDDLIDEALKK